jgi:HSP20 family protein
MPNGVQKNEGEAETLSPQRYRELWDPFRLMREMFRWDPLRESGVAALAGGFIPRFEMTEGKDAYVVRADLPGIEEDDVEISLTKNELTISGHREQEHREPDARTYTSERAFGHFTRSFTLPEGADQEHLRAEMKNGVLTLTIPKRREVKPRRISIERHGGHKAKA